MSINIRLGTESDKQKLLTDYLNLNNFLGDNGHLIIAEKDEDIVGFLWAFIRDIPAPVEAEEMFINVIEVLHTELRCQGIGSQMVQKIIEIARNERVYQVRAYVQIGNVPSHRLWLKNKFSISPVKMPDDSIVGSFVTYVLE